MTSTADQPDPGVEAESSTAGLTGRTRATVQMTALTLVSRLTGFARVVVVAAVLGTSYLGNVYQSANTIPNILFELFAAGALQSVLVPIMVDAVDRRGGSDAEQTAGVVLGAMLSLLGALVAASMVAAPLLMRMLVSGVDNAAVRHAQVQLGTFLLWFFLPQLLFYAANLVATAVLNARGHFALPVFAPTVNNVVVIATYLVFGWMRNDQPPSLDLTLAQKLVLALGTTLGVVAFCAVPVIGVWRIGFRLRPRLDRHHPVIRRLAGDGLWAAGFLALAQVLLVVVLYLSNAVEGGVVVYQLAFVLFMLPNSLFAVPVFTTAFPTLTRTARSGDWGTFADEVGRAARAIAFFTFLSAGALVALADPLAHLVALGNASGQASEIAGAIAAFALGLPAYSFILFLTRVNYAYGRVSVPTWANLVVAMVGTVAMVALVAALPSEHRITAIGLGFSLAQCVGAVILSVVVRRRIHAHGARMHSVVLPVGRSFVAALLSTAAAVVVSLSLAGESVSANVAAVCLAGATIGAMTVCLQWALGGPDPLTAARSFGGDPGRWRGTA